MDPWEFDDSIPLTSPASGRGSEKKNILLVKFLKIIKTVNFHSWNNTACIIIPNEQCLAVNVMNL